MTERDKQTVLAYAENNMCISATARNAFLHRNAVIYRLNAVWRRTGLDPRKFHGLVKLVEMCKGDNE